MGTYFGVLGGTNFAGSVCTLIGMNSYGAMDTLAAAGGEYSRLVNEIVVFFDRSNGDNGARVILKKATEATTYGD